MDVSDVFIYVHIVIYYIQIIDITVHKCVYDIGDIYIRIHFGIYMNCSRRWPRNEIQVGLFNLIIILV